ncbi:GH39 family glycosyl hydrolase [Silvibacterium sp.]|uniref:GH39 family glycosyl hydrolase n=1 Tax=Silvibacterium sp. TaxID=1964179 RepID=UPI0039E29F3B
MGQWWRRIFWALLIVLGAAVLVLGVAYLWIRYLPPPSLPQSKILVPVGCITASAGRGQITVAWTPVENAVGYQVQRSTHANGPFALVSSAYGAAPVFLQNLLERAYPGEPFGRLPRSPFVDTDIRPGTTYYYRVRANDGSAWSPVGATGSAVAASDSTSEPIVRIEVDAGQDAGLFAHKWEMAFGSEHLSYMLKGDINDHLRNAGAGLRAGNRLAHDTLGMRYVRAHGILMDDPSVYTEDAQGHAHYDWSKVDQLYDMVRADGMRPFVELSFMPRALAAHPGATTVFTYKGISSPPKDYAKWQALVAALTQHLVDRYGQAEVETWPFEVWNEPDLKITPDFWSGTMEQYFRLYDYAAAGIKAVDPKIMVGGPVVAFTTFQEPFLRHVTTKDYATGATHAPLDFLDMHNYYLPVSDYRPLLRRYGLGNVPVYFTEWGVSPEYGDAVSDTAYAAAAAIHGVFDSLDQVTVLSPWTASDYFEESGNPKALFHGGFGMIGLDGLRKARYWAFYELHRMGTHRAAMTGTGDGYGGLVQGVATRDGGTVAALLANATDEHAKSMGAPALDRHVVLTVKGLVPGQAYTVEHDRIDNTHSNVYGAWQSMGSPKWPDASAMRVLHERDGLQTLEPDARIMADAQGEAVLEFDLPMPAVSFVRLSLDLAVR